MDAFDMKVIEMLIQLSKEAAAKGELGKPEEDNE